MAVEDSYGADSISDRSDDAFESGSDYSPIRGQGNNDNFGATAAQV